VLTARERADEVSVNLIGSGVEAIVLLLTKRHDGSASGDTRVVGADEVLGVEGGCVRRNDRSGDCVED
jgi:hypothetical protein